MSNVLNAIRLLGLGVLLAAPFALPAPVTARSDETDEDVDVRVEPKGRKVTNSIGMTFAPIPKGKFMMGAAKDDREAQSSDKPRHEVEVTKGFYLGIYEVTQKQYKQVRGYNPSWVVGGQGGFQSLGNTDDFPVEKVSWDDARAFVAKLNDSPAEKAAKRKYRLPTEAEWEYACRAGTKTVYAFGNKLTARQANFGNSLGRTCKVGSYPPNEWGLYDMHGNVFEWCQDNFSATYYADSPLRDPRGPAKEDNWRHRVRRGGGWAWDVKYCGSAARDYRTATVGASDYGFRVAMEAK
jgi:formylglycine-generating enzyme required for sulfatase activity